ncbi:hypothetical protein [Nonomuraea sp. NPDC049400]|uniref:ISAzo13-like element transposase-related protein n=1 Tax=Nonomuraea sp. NPDC049400 TaxID=3364352 RepID=UPI003788025A
MELEGVAAALGTELDTGQYATGVTISDAQLADLPITSHYWHSDWNYTLLPAWPTPHHPDHH